VEYQKCFKQVGNSPAALSGFIGVLGALAKGGLSAKEREAIALAVAESNRCSYCLSAHTALGKGAGMTESETCDIRLGQIQEPKCKGLISFVAAVVEKKGDVSDADVKSVRDAGYSDGQITEILLTIAINYFTNIFNLVNKTKVDFPVVLPGQKVPV
jgi:AhpD family alkylhydroperoxidase